MINKKIYFISDAHLGAKTIQNPHEQEKKLTRWLDSIKEDASAIYLMGDMIDFWFEYKNVVPRGFTRFFGKLAELSDLGIEVHWFIGNHDIWIFDYIPNEIGVIIHKGPEKAEILGKTFFLAHGDGLADKSISDKITRSLFHSRICQWMLATVHPRWTIGFALAWSRHSRETGENAQYRGEDNEFLVVFSKKYLKENPDINYFIYGHRHIILNLMIAKDSNVIILGDWITHFSYAVFDGESMEIKIFEGEDS